MSERKELTAEQRRVLLEGGTEAPFSGAYVHEKGKGMYRCAQCGAELFSSETKFDSKTGWPSFDQALPGAVTYKDDDTHGMRRTEVLCARCGGHLGHVFDDGPEETTGKRYCINSVCLDLEKQD
ncbi:MAG: hypothetical protein AMXMBFR44_6460 [Candidatus Campbellbacteria bacterium]